MEPQPHLDRRVVFLDDLTVGDFLVHREMPDGALGLVKLDPAELSAFPGPVYQLCLIAGRRMARIRRVLRSDETPAPNPESP